MDLDGGPSFPDMMSLSGQQSMGSLGDEKRTLRQEMRQRIASLPPERKREADALIDRQILESPLWREARCVFCFASLPTEVDTWPLIMDALGAKKRLCVPLCTDPGLMELHQITDTRDLRPGKWGILEPCPDTPRLEPSDVFLAIVPCLACDAFGMRLGKGGGYYDRFLSTYRGISLTMSYEGLLLDEAPADVWDIPVPFVVTERGIRHQGRFVSKPL